MIKKIFYTLIIGLTILLGGCKQVEFCSQPTTDKKAVTTDFNQENYIWENWIFPDNKTTGK